MKKLVEIVSAALLGLVFVVSGCASSSGNNSQQRDYYNSYLSTPPTPEHAPYVPPGKTPPVFTK
jgi:uncharacterized lipoprotein